MLGYIYSKITGKRSPRRGSQNEGDGLFFAGEDGHAERGDGHEGHGRGDDIIGAGAGVLGVIGAGGGSGVAAIAGHDDGDGLRNNIAIGVQFLAINNVGFINVLFESTTGNLDSGISFLCEGRFKIAAFNFDAAHISSYIALEITILNNKLMSIMGWINAAA